DDEADTWQNQPILHICPAITISDLASTTEECIGCNFAAMDFFVTKKDFDETAEIQELFSQPIHWAED
ncbi:hypothetical protein AK812_SmicGene47535, partial [Symbiodinium microadriaticum]